MLYPCYTFRATTRGELFSTATSPPAREFKKIAADGKNRLLKSKATNQIQTEFNWIHDYQSARQKSRYKNVIKR